MRRLVLFLQKQRKGIPIALERQNHDCMKVGSGIIRLSASDLSNHLACHHLTSLDLAVAIGVRPAPDWHSPDARVLQERGMAHEDAYLAHLEAHGVSILNLRDIGDAEQALAETRTAMKKGVEAIAQATLANGRWFGRSDILRRVERASRPGGWSYEVYDCKLACETKAATILQLSVCSELLESIQGVVPESMYVVPPGVDFQPEQYRALDFAAVSVQHEGNRNASAEEVECIAELVDGLRQSGVNWIDDKGQKPSAAVERRAHCSALQCTGLRPVEAYSPRAGRHGG